MSWEHRVLLFFVGCHGIVLWRLWSEKIAGLYPFLTAFVAAEMVQSVVLFPIRRSSHLYAFLFEFSTAAIWVVAYLVVLELYRLTLEDYPGIASVGRKAVSWSLALAIVVSVLYAVPDLRSAGGSGQGALYEIMLRIFPVLERSTVLGLLLFLVLIQMFLYHYRLQLSRNRMIYVTGYALYFGISMALDILWTSLGVVAVTWISLWTVAAAGIVLLAGAALLNEQGEARVVLEPAHTNSDRERLRGQLAEMNRMLTRAARGRG